MLQNYFKTAWRNLLKNKVSALINVLGLSLGVSACLAIYLVSSFELSFENFHPDRNRIFRVVTKMEGPVIGRNFSSTVPGPAPDVFREEIPGMESIAVFRNYYAKVEIPGRGEISGKVFDQPDKDDEKSPVIIAEPSYFDIFKYKWLYGNPHAAMNEPHQVVLSEKGARKYFGDIALKKVIGRDIIYNDSLRVTVSGIVEDFGQNTDFKFTDFISYSTITHSFLENYFKGQGTWDNWDGWNNNTQVYVRLDKITDTARINAAFAPILKLT